MSVIPFIKPNKTERKIAKQGHSVIMDSGQIGEIEYEVINVGGKFPVIHIFDETLTFKKDFESFGEILGGIKFEDMKDGDRHLIKGSGDNDNLIFTRQNGDVSVSLERRGFDTIEKLKGILTKDYEKKEDEKCSKKS